MPPAAVPRDVIAQLNADAVAGQGYFVVASRVAAFNEFISKAIPR